MNNDEKIQKMSQVYELEKDIGITRTKALWNSVMVGIYSIGTVCNGITAVKYFSQERYGMAALFTFFGLLTSSGVSDRYKARAERKKELKEMKFKLKLLNDECLEDKAAAASKALEEAKRRETIDDVVEQKDKEKVLKL